MIINTQNGPDKLVSTRETELAVFQLSQTLVEKIKATKK